MKIKICDRCGVKICDEIQQAILPIYSICGMYDSNYSKSIDLCSKCQRDLDKWLENKEDTIDKRTESQKAYDRGFDDGLEEGIKATGSTTENSFNNLDLSTKICELKNRIVSSDGQDYVQLYDVLETIKRHNEPCTDAISREDALMALTGEWTESRDELIAKFIRRIKKLQSVEPVERWIPVSEGLPDNEDVVVVTIKDEHGDSPFIYSDFAWYLKDGKCWIYNAEKSNDIVAWTPLPEPWKGCEE